MLDALDQARQSIATEAISLERLSLTDLFQRFLPDTRAIISKFSDTFAEPLEAAAYTKDQHEFLRLVQQRKFLDLAALGMTVPEGMSATYLQYLSALYPITAYCMEVHGRLTEFSTQLALLISNKDQLLSSRDETVFFKKMEQSRQELVKEVARCFQNGSHRTDVRYDDVVDRNSDWPLVFRELAKVTDTANKIDRKVLAKTTKQTVELLDKLIEMVERGSMEEGNAEVVAGLSEGAYQMGSELELVAVTIFKVLAITEAIDSSTQKLHAILKVG